MGISEILEQVVSIIIQQGLTGALLIILGWAYWKQGQELQKARTEKEELYKFMYEESEKDNTQKMEYLNEHVVAITKTGDALATQTTTLQEMKTKIDSLVTDMGIIKGKV